MMKRFIALVVARNKEFYRDQTTLVWTFLFPFIVLAGFAYGYSGKQDPVLRISLVGVSDALTDELRLIPGLDVLKSADEPAARKKLERYESDLLLASAGGDGPLAYSLNPDSPKGKLAERLLLDTISRHPEPRPKLEFRAVNGRKIRYADWVLPGLLSMNIMFGSMFGVGYIIVRYRKNGVLKRLRATPLSAFQFLAAQVMSRMMLMVVSSLIVLGGATLLIGFRNMGHWLDVIVFLAVSATAMISLGLVVAARISSEEVAEGVLNLMTWPMIFLSGIWFSLEGANPWVAKGAQLVPLTHVVDGLRAILIDGAGLAQLMPQITILLVLSFVFLTVGSLAFRWR